MSEKETNSVPVTQLLRLAERHEQAGRPAKAAGLYRLAGFQAAARYDNDTALCCLTSALRLTPDDFPAERFTVLLARERLLGLLGRSEAQARDLAGLEALAERLDDDDRRAQVAARQASWREMTGDLAAAVSLAAIAARLARLAEAHEAEAMAHFAWGRALLRQGEYDQAGARLEQALGLARATGERQLEADILRYLGVLSTDRGCYPAARDYGEQAGALYERLGDRQGLVHVRTNLGHVHLALGEIEAARQQWEAAHTLFAQLGDAEGGVRTLINLGAAASDVGLYGQARGYNEAALEQARAIGLSLGELFALLNLGLIDHYQGQNERAVTRLRQAQALAEKMGSKRYQGHALAVLGHALLELDEPAAAGDAYWEALAIWEELSLPNLAAATRAGLARAALRHDTPDLAAWFVEDILAQAAVDRRFSGAELPVRIYLTCYDVLARQGDPRADEVLATGQRLLDELADGLADEASRQALRHNIPAHRALMAVA